MRNLLDVWRSERIDPWREFSLLQRQMDRLFDDVIRQEPKANFPRAVDFVPACDVEETDNHYLIALDIPGLTKDQIQVEITGNTLRISGEKKEERKEGKTSPQVYERYRGRFERSFTLPQLAATDQIQADYKDGVLRVSVPKSEEAKARTRKVQIGESKNPLFAKPPQRSEEKKEAKTGEKAA